jgi:lipopolysaccharide/colanic/teichoic acid biosynthesis glycosyltransferase
MILFVLTPFLILVSILIKLDSKGPIFFRQVRVGKGLNTFNFLKFRSMTNIEREVKPVHGRASGVTKVGYYLRRFKIDELPQLYHVLIGQMSLVGPRPSIPAQLEQMTELEKNRYSVSPGLTGLAQVSGNIHLPWQERYKVDLKYIRNISVLNDLRIICRTVLLIFIGEEKFVDQPLKIKTYDK